MDDTPEVRHDEAGRRYVVEVGGTNAGYASYEHGEGSVTFTHTVVDPAFRGRGLGELLVERAVADAVAEGRTIVPECSFAARYLDTHDVPGATVRRPGPSGA